MPRRDISSPMAPLVISGLTLATAAIHLSRAVANPHIRVLFTLNALGYLCILALFLLPMSGIAERRLWVRRVFLAYVALTFVLFFVWGIIKGEWPAVGFADKLIEAALFWLLLAQDSATPAGRGPVPSA